MIRSDKWIGNNSAWINANPNHISSNSLDLCLGGNFRVFDYNHAKLPFGYHQRIEHEVAGQHVVTEYVFENISRGLQFTILPGTLVIAHSEEYIKLPSDIAGFLALKSTAARHGLQHANAGFVEPTFQGQLVFEFSSLIPVRLTVGEPYMQLVFFDAERSERPYREVGHYMGQKGAQVEYVRTTY